MKRVENEEDGEKRRRLLIASLGLDGVVKVWEENKEDTKSDKEGAVVEASAEEDAAGEEGAAGDGSAFEDATGEDTACESSADVSGSDDESAGVACTLTCTVGSDLLSTPCTAMAVHGDVLACGTLQGNVKILHVKECGGFEVLATMPPYKDGPAVTSLAWSSDGSNLAVCLKGGDTCVYALPPSSSSLPPPPPLSPSYVAVGLGGGYHARCACFTGDSGLLIVGCDDGCAYAHDHFKGGCLVGSIRGGGGMVSCLACMPLDDNLVAAAGEDGGVRIFNLQSLAVVHTFDGTGGAVRGMAVTGGGRRMAFGGEGGDLVIVCTQ